MQVGKDTMADAPHCASGALPRTCQPDKAPRRREVAGGFCGKLAEGLEDLQPSTFLPILGWFPHFLRNRPLKSVASDLMTGITVAAVVVPQGMAYGMLAGVPPVYGLYTALFPTLAYAVFGSCMHLSVGPSSPIAVLTAACISTMVLNPADVEGAVAAAAVLAFLSGAFLVGAGVLRLGFVATFFSDPALSGYNTAVAIISLTSQLKYAFSVHVSRGEWVSTVRQLVERVLGGDTNWMSLLIFACSLAVIFSMQALNQSPRFPRLKKTPLPAELTVVVLSTAVCLLLKLSETHGVPVLGTVPKGLPSFSFSALSEVSSDLQRQNTAPELRRFDFSTLVSDASMISLMTYITAMSVSKTFARKFGYEVDNNQELIALGSANLLGSFTSCFPATASLSRTSLVAGSGAATPLHGVWTALVLVLVLLFCSPLLQTLPMAGLAAVVVAAFKSVLLNGFREARMNWKVGKSDFVVWVVAFFATLFAGVTSGIAIAVAVNMFFLLFKTTLPAHAVLGRLEGTERLYRNRRLFEHAQVIKGVMLFRVDAALHFANRETFATQLTRNLLQHDAELSGAPFDARLTFWGGVRKLGGAMRLRSDRENFDDSEDGAEPRKVEAVVVDFSAVTHIDISAARTLEKLRSELAARRTRLVVAHCHYKVHEKLASMSFFDCFEPSGELDVVCFCELHDAVLFAEGRLRFARDEEVGDATRGSATQPAVSRSATSRISSWVSRTGSLSQPGLGRQATMTQRLEEQGVAVGHNEHGDMEIVRA